MKGRDGMYYRMRGSPVTLAAVFAAQLESDPIMAAKVKEHLPPKRLMQLLDIRDEPYYRVPLVAFTDDELKAELARREANRIEQANNQPQLPLESTQNGSGS